MKVVLLIYIVLLARNHFEWIQIDFENQIYFFVAFHPRCASLKHAGACGNQFIWQNTFFWLFYCAHTTVYEVWNWHHFHPLSFSHALLLITS